MRDTPDMARERQGERAFKCVTHRKWPAKGKVNARTSMHMIARTHTHARCGTRLCVPDCCRLLISSQLHLLLAVLITLHQFHKGVLRLRSPDDGRSAVSTCERWSEVIESTSPPPSDCAVAFFSC